MGSLHSILQSLFSHNCLVNLDLSELYLFRFASFKEFETKYLQQSWQWTVKCNHRWSCIVTTIHLLAMKISKLLHINDEEQSIFCSWQWQPLLTNFWIFAARDDHNYWIKAILPGQNCDKWLFFWVHDIGHCAVRATFVCNSDCWLT